MVGTVVTPKKWLWHIPWIVGGAIVLNLSKAGTPSLNFSPANGERSWTIASLRNCGLSTVAGLLCALPMNGTTILAHGFALTATRTGNLTQTDSCITGTLA